MELLNLFILSYSEFKKYLITYISVLSLLKFNPIKLSHCVETTIMDRQKNGQSRQYLSIVIRTSRLKANSSCLFSASHLHDSVSHPTPTSPITTMSRKPNSFYMQFNNFINSKVLVLKRWCFKWLPCQPLVCFTESNTSKLIMIISNPNFTIYLYKFR